MKFLAHQKFRFDLGQSFFSILNFVFIVVAASDKIGTLVGWSAKAIVCIAVPGAILGVWFFGFVLDKLGFYHKYNEVINERNEMLRKVCEK
jgi:hypothetical protein